MSAASDTLEQDMIPPEGTELIERLVERENMLKAYHRVVGNKGAAGVDGMTVDKLRAFLKEHWVTIKGQLLSGTYYPQPVRGVEIPKPGGGRRRLGIPTVVDRMIQQALYQVLNPLFEPHFSESSYGFREGRNAHQAVLKAKEFQIEGKRWVVDIDLAKFFDEVNHDLLVARVSRKVKDWRVLTLIRRYLRAGILRDGRIEGRDKGTPQGGNLSPFLSNIMLDDLDRELEQRGHSFCRYADDCNIYVGSRKAGERVMTAITRFVEIKLKLRVNREKSAVARPWVRKFLGYSFTNERHPRIRVPRETIRRLKANLKQEFRKGRGRNIKRHIADDLNPVIRGWIDFFSLAEVKTFTEDLDGWIRRKCRGILWRQWKRPWTRKVKLMKRGLGENRAVQSAFNGRGPWWNAGASHMNAAFPKKYFDTLGLVSMVDRLCLNRLTG
jgi:RNA-directed DNA polymerase